MRICSDFLLYFQLIVLNVFASVLSQIATDDIGMDIYNTDVTGVVRLKPGSKKI